MDGVTAGLVATGPPGTDLTEIATVTPVTAGDSNADLPDAVLHANTQGGDRFTEMGNMMGVPRLWRFNSTPNQQGSSPMKLTQ